MNISVFLYKFCLFYITIIVYYFKKIKDFFRKPILINKYPTDNSVLKESECLSIDQKTKLKLYCEPLNLNFLQKIFMDITQGSGYDFILEEEAKLSKIFWLGNHKRSITHEKSINILDKFLKDKNNIKILDIGCGSGTTSIRLDKFLKSKNIDFKIYGCDIYPNVLVEYIHNIKNKDIKPELLICNGENLPYQDSIFDLVINFGSINQFNNVKKGLNEMLRVVKKDGLCMCRDEHYNETLLNNFEKEYFSFIKNQKIPDNLLPENHSYEIININKIHFLLVF